MSPLQNILSRLDKPREVARGRWRCVCPAHDGKNRTALSVTEADNGAVLLRCWHGCSLEAIAASLGLEVSELFPPKPREPGGGAGPMRQPFIPAQVFEVLTTEATVVSIVASDILQGREVDSAAMARLRKAQSRLADISGAAYGRR